MKDVLLFAILGIGSGASYALIALGIVLIQKGSGAVNFAQGAIAGCSAIFFASATNNGMGRIPALLIALLGAATLGTLFYVLVMRPLRTAPLLARIVATLGLMIVLSALAVKVWGSLSVVAPSLFPTDSLSIFNIAFGVDRLYLLGVTIILTALLWAVYRFTGFGIATRAVAESERAASLLGLSPDLIGAANWALGCMLAAFAGVMIAPLTTLDISPLTLLVLPALAAALVGRFTSFGITTAVALGIGVIQSLLVRYWTQQGVNDAVPFVIVIVTMIAGGKLIPARGTLSLARLPLAPASRFRLVPALVAAAVVVIGLATLNRTYQGGISTSLVTVIIALSAVVVTGFVGQISLMQLAFAGIGGFMVSKLGVNAGIPFPWPIILAAVVAVPVGIVLGLPAVRVRGINLAVVTLGAAVAVSAVVFQNAHWTGGVSGSQVPSPGFFSFSIDPEKYPIRFGIFALVVTMLMIFAVINLRRSPFGRRMLAVRSNERAAAVIGINVVATKLQAFALSAFIAGIGGGVLAYQLGAIAFERFSPMASITLLAIAYIGGIATVGGAIAAGVIVNGGVLYVALSNFEGLASWWVVISGAALLLTAVTQPDGIAVA
ncbi:MAG: branched-chain amino acid transport system permease protein livM, partial [Solirubrobacteraceae bacterium]|nr:branched-chain amino acid transport system permease protein livM [Solirubrobacteraceae bacterium]